MDKTKIGLIIVIAIVAVLAVAAIFSMGLAKTDTKLDILGNGSFTQDDKVIVSLQDESGALENKTIHFKFIDKKGNVSEYSVNTNIHGKARMSLKDVGPGKYTVNVTFEGDDKYNPSNTSKKIEVKEVVVEEEPVYVEPTTSNQQTSSGDSDIAEYRDFIGWDYAPGVHVRETTYKNGDIKHEYDDGSSDYYDSSAQEWRYKDADGRQGSMYVGN